MVAKIDSPITPLEQTEKINSVIDDLDNKMYRAELDGIRAGCITEISQDIKLEQNASTLTLKAGSKVYVPDGFEQDGTTPKFSVATAETDIVAGTSGSSSELDCCLVAVVSGGAITDITWQGKSETVTGSTASSTYTICYNTSTNKVGFSGSTTTINYSLTLSLPFAVCKNLTNNQGWKSIENIFNGFGYVGSTVFALPGVKGIIPNGRNSDGTLNNIKLTIDSVKTATRTWTNDGEQVFGYTKNPPSGVREFWMFNRYICSETEPQRNSYTLWYKPSENITFVHNDDLSSTPSWERISYINFGDCPGEHGKEIKLFSSKVAFKSLDYNDKKNVSDWVMPSSYKYVDITLGASGTTYVAPASGWFVLAKKSTAASQYYAIANETNGMQVAHNVTGSGQTPYMFFPCKQGDVISVTYNLGGATSRFRFIYSKGVLE